MSLCPELMAKCGPGTQVHTQLSPVSLASHRLLSLLGWPSALDLILLAWVLNNLPNSCQALLTKDSSQLPCT